MFIYCYTKKKLLTDWYQPRNATVLFYICTHKYQFHGTSLVSNATFEFALIYTLFKTHVQGAADVFIF